MKRVPVYFEIDCLGGNAFIRYRPRYPCRVINIIVDEAPVGAELVGFMIGNRLQLRFDSPSSIGIPLLAFWRGEGDWEPTYLKTDICDPTKDIALTIEGPPGKIVLSLIVEIGDDITDF